MKAFPHSYPVTAQADAGDTLVLSAEGFPDLPSAAPPEFDGPGGQWSPESLLVAAAASCFVLTFRAVARASKLDWLALECRCEGKLDRVERTTRFTHLTTHARLSVPSGTNEELCRRLLEKAEHGCLVVNSLNCSRELQAEVAAAS